jgi:hypothetical protein
MQRSISRSKAPSVVRLIPKPKEGTLCLVCASVLRRKTWRRRELSFGAWLRAPRALCPACREALSERAAPTEPERRVVAIENRDGVLHVYTTSQKLAQRIAAELRKAFGGRVRYAWADPDGRLFARWETGA